MTNKYWDTSDQREHNKITKNKTGRGAQGQQTEVIQTLTQKEQSEKEIKYN